MPGMDGYEATRAIRKRDREWLRRPIVAAMTARALSSDRDRCLAAGMDDYISKPITLDTLGALLRRWDVPLRPTIIEELRQLAGDRFDVLTKDFSENLGRYLGEMRAGLAAGDAEALRRGAHALRGSGGSFGAFGLENICELIETAAGRGGSKDIPDLIDELSDECSRVERALEKL